MFSFSSRFLSRLAIFSIAIIAVIAIAQTAQIANISDIEDSKMKLGEMEHLQDVLKIISTVALAVTLATSIGGNYLGSRVDTLRKDIDTQREIHIKGIELQLEQEHIKRLQLEADIKYDRGFSPAITNKLVESLFKLPKERIEIFSLKGCSECFGFAFQILEMFRSAKWNIGTGISETPIMLSKGIMIQANDPKYTSLANEIASIFKSVGLESFIVTMNATPPDTTQAPIYIYVGTKDYH